jgi:rod shape-determining protein MreC
LKRKNWVIIGLLVAGWISFLGQPTTISTKLRMIFVQLSTPFVKLGDYIPAVKSRRDLDKQNRELRTENEVLRQQVRALAEAGNENLRLTHLLKLTEHSSFRTIGARVIGRDAGNWWKSIQIDRGTNDGIRENLPVLNADGLVGKVVKVTRGEARVLLLIDPNCKVSAVLQDSRQPGVVAGTQMTYVDCAAKIKPGENVITSGLGGIFPKGILIGAVVKAELNPQTGMYQDVEIKPAVDFRRLEEVVVILE